MAVRRPGIGGPVSLGGLADSLYASPRLVALRQLAARLNVRPNGLPAELRAGIEAHSGLSMDAVRVHRNSPYPAQLNAKAAAQGTNIHLAPGEDHHLPHEAWHVVQQAQGRVRPTLQLAAGTPVNDDPVLEAEADTMGRKALSASPQDAVGVPPPAVPGFGAELLVQRVIRIKTKTRQIGPIRIAIAAVRAFLEQGRSETLVYRTHRTHDIYKTLKSKAAYLNREEAILQVIEGWLNDDVDDESRNFDGWGDVLEQASAQVNLQNARRGRSEEDQKEYEKRLQESFSGEPKGFGSLDFFDQPPRSEAEKRDAEDLELFNDEASQTTDLLYDWPYGFDEFESEFKEELEDVEEKEGQEESEERSQGKELPKKRKYKEESLDNLVAQGGYGSGEEHEDEEEQEKQEGSTKETGGLFVAVKRRKLHKAGRSKNLPGDQIRYRSYQGTISPQANAFVLGGSNLEQDYGPLLDKLLKALRLEAKQNRQKPPTDQQVAALFLKEMEGQDSFGLFGEEVKRRAHKIIAIILFAELSRHSIALVSAAAAFHAVASQVEKKAESLDKEEDANEERLPEKSDLLEADDLLEEDDLSPEKESSKEAAPALGLVEAFATGSGKERPLFAGSGGPDLMRNKKVVKDMTAEETQTRRARGVVDLKNFLKANKQEGEDVSQVLPRKTLQYLLALWEHTDQKGSRPEWLDGALSNFFRKVWFQKNNDKGRKNDAALDPVAHLVQLGFQHIAQPGDENDCAINSLYDQLTVRNGINLGEKTAFVKYVREWMVRNGGARMGSMLDLVAQGGALLRAAQDYITHVMGEAAPPGISINVWAAIGGGGLFQYDNVARVGNGANICVLYFNGVNHFDSLQNGPV